MIFIVHHFLSGTPSVMLNTTSLREKNADSCPFLSTHDAGYKQVIIKSSQQRVNNNNDHIGTCSKKIYQEYNEEEGLIGTTITPCGSRVLTHARNQLRVWHLYTGYIALNIHVA